MKICQVVFLLDLSAVSKDSPNVPSGYTLNVKCLRRAILKFLTYFSACKSGPDTSDLKWGCKYYNSLVKKPIRQVCTFKDFNLEVFQTFENELDDKLEKYWSEEEAAKVESVVSKASTSMASSPRCKSAPKFYSNPLELALKEVLCDYPWDNPYITSPVRMTRRQTRNLKDRTDSSSTTENVVIVLAALPKLLQHVEQCSEKTPRNFNTNDVLKTMMSPTLQEQFYRVNKIRLFWFDICHSCEAASTQSSSLVKYLDRALYNIGGGIIPLNAVLPCYSQQCGSGAMPESLKLTVPFGSLMSGYFQNKQVGTKQRTCYSSLKLNSGEPLVYELELMPLFRQNICAQNVSDLTDIPEKWRPDPSEIPGALSNPNFLPDPDFQKLLAELRPIGTISLRDIRSLLEGRPFVFVCFASDAAPPARKIENETKYHHLLWALTECRRALLLSCTDVCQGVLIATTSKCQIGVLYLLASEEIQQFIGDSDSSMPPQINDFIQNVFQNWSPCQDLEKHSDQLTAPTTESSNDYVLSPTYLEKWSKDCFIQQIFRSDVLTRQHESLLERQRQVFQELRKAYLPSVLLQKQQPKENSTTLKGNERSPKFKSPKRLRHLTGSSAQQSLEPCCSSDNSLHSVIIQRSLSKDKASSTTTDSVIVKNESELVTELKNVYDSVLRDADGLDLQSAVQQMINLCITYYTNECSVNSQMAARDLIVNNVLLKPTDVVRKHADTNKKLHVREHCLQVVLRLELLVHLEADPAGSKISLDDIVSHLRRLSFIDGPATMSNFLQEIIIENYQFSLTEAVREICEDLNQPFPSTKTCDSASSSATTSPEKECSIMNVLSELSEFSNSPSWSSPVKSAPKPKRLDAIVRHPSLSRIALQRQISVSKKHAASTSSKGRFSKHKAARCPAEEKRASRRSQTRKSCPTTPRGRHVLKTTKVSETPVHKQVAHPMLAKQALKRKYTSDPTENSVMVVEESPDNKPSPTLRRSPRLHPSSQMGRIEKSALGTPSQTLDSQKNSQNKLQRGTPKRTPDRRARACRKLMLDASSSPDAKKKRDKTPSKGSSYSSPCALRRSPRLQKPTAANLNECLEDSIEKGSERRQKLGFNKFYSKNSESRLSFTSLSNSNNINNCDQDEICSPTRGLDQSEKCNEFTDSGTVELLHKLPVTRRILQTPSKTKDGPESSHQNDLLRENINTNIQSTPVRRGEVSPAAKSNDLLYGSLSDCLEKYVSPPTSPIIPFIYDGYRNIGDHCPDENLYVSEVPKDVPNSRQYYRSVESPADWRPSSTSDWVPSSTLEEESCVRPEEDSVFLLSNSSDFPNNEGTVQKPTLSASCHAGGTSDSRQPPKKPSKHSQSDSKPGLTATSLLQLTSSPIITHFTRSSRQVKSQNTLKF